MNNRKLNLYACILHYSLAIIFSIYFQNLNNKYKNDPVQGVELSIRDHVLSISKQPCNTPNSGNCDSSGNETVSNWNSEETTIVDIKTVQKLLISFFVITGTFHLFYYLTSNPLENGNVLNNSYTRVVSDKNNFFRWIEYSITSTIMLYIIALISGVKDTNVYMLLFSMNATMIYTGQIVEEYKRDKPNSNKWVVPMAVGFILLLSEFSVIIRSFQQRISQVNSFLEKNKSTEGKIKKIPSWINYTIYSLFMFFSCFGFIALVYSIFNIKYENIENTYIIFSFLAKATLGIFIAYGTSQRQKSSKKSS